jgi:two-component system, NtrC family, sensor kinase
MKGLLRTSIRLKLTLFVAVIVALTAGVLGVVGYGCARQILRNQINDRLSVLRADRQKMLLDYVQNQQSLLKLVASRTRLREFLEACQAGRLSETAFREQTRPLLDDSLQSCASFQALWVADPQGVVVATTAADFLGKDLSSAPEFREGRERAHVGLMSSREGQYRMVAVAPARNREGQLLGVVMALLDARGVVAAVTDVAGLGRTGEVLLGTRAGDRLHYLVPGRFARELVDVPAAAAPAMDAAIRGQKGFMRTHDRRGVEVLAAYGPVGYLDWGMVAKIDEAEADQPILWLHRLFAGLFLALLALGGWEIGRAHV